MENRRKDKLPSHYSPCHASTDAAGGVLPKHTPVGTRPAPAEGSGELLRDRGARRMSWDFPSLRFDAQRTEGENNRKACSVLRRLQVTAVKLPRECLVSIYNHTEESRGNIEVIFVFMDTTGMGKYRFTVVSP